MALRGPAPWRATSRSPAARSLPRMLGVPSEPLRQRSGRLANAAIAGGVDALKTVSAENLSPQEIARLLARPRIDFSSILKTVGGPAAPPGGRICGRDEAGGHMGRGGGGAGPAAAGAGRRPARGGAGGAPRRAAPGRRALQRGPAAAPAASAGRPRSRRAPRRRLPRAADPPPTPTPTPTPTTPGRADRRRGARAGRRRGQALHLQV
jgi:hypothetical protein